MNLTYLQILCNGHAYFIKIGGKVFEIKVDKVQWFIQSYYSDANLINKKYIIGIASNGCLLTGVPNTHSI